MQATRSTAALGMVIAAAVAWPASAPGQSRREVSIQSVGSTANTLGQSDVSRHFNRYSYGLGNVGGNPSAQANRVLESSISIPYSVNISRAASSAATLGGPAAVPSAGSSSIRAYDPQAISIPMDVGPLRQAEPSLGFGELAPINPYISSSGKGADVTLAPMMPAGAPVNSFVPQRPSEYAQWMKEGEAACRAGDFEHAYELFVRAKSLAGKDPESHLSLAHAGVALAAFSYSEPALHVRMALRYLPELALAPLKPSAFFGDSPDGRQRYAQHLGRLAAHIAERPDDTDAQLLMAYFRWFEGDGPAAREALSRAASSARAIEDADALEAVDIFWKGMVASGRLSPGLSELSDVVEEQPASAPSPPPPQPAEP